MATVTCHNPASVHAPSKGDSMGLELEGHGAFSSSAQVPADSSGAVPESFEAQCEQAWRNIISLLAAARLYPVPSRWNRSPFHRHSRESGNPGP